MQKTLRNALTATGAALLLLSGPASAAPGDPDGAGGTALPAGRGAEIAAELDAKMQVYSIPADDRERLVDSYLDGDRWDSLTPGEQPVSVEEVTHEGVRYEVRRFDDGSVQASGIEIPELAGDFSPQNIENCSIQSSGTTTLFSNCEVVEDVIAARASFAANYRIDSSYGTASITYAGAPSIYVIGGSASNINVDIVRATYAPTYPAIAELTFVGTLPDGWGSAALYVQLQVTSGGAISLSNFDILPD